MITSKHFDGNPCIKCGETLRYISTGQCVDCTLNAPKRSKQNEELALQAKANNLKAYVPTSPCHLGHIARYVNSNNCIECDMIARRKHATTAKFTRIKREYGLSKEQYLQLVQDQNSSCQLCNEFEENHFQLHIDHCHNTKKVRSLLCTNCNRGIGHLKHNSELLRKAALYCEQA